MPLVRRTTYVLGLPKGIQRILAARRKGSAVRTGRPAPTPCRIAVTVRLGPAPLRARGRVPLTTRAALTHRPRIMQIAAAIRTAVTRIAETQHRATTTLHPVTTADMRRRAATPRRAPTPRPRAPIRRRTLVAGSGVRAVVVPVVDSMAAVAEATGAVADTTKESLQPPNKPAPSIRSGFCSYGLIVFVSRLRRRRNPGVPGVLNVMMTGFQAELHP